MAAEAQPLRSLVNPDDRAFLKPDDMAAAIRDWCVRYGEPVPQTEGELIRCALESLAFKYRMVLEWLEELTGTRIETIHIVGGGCQNESLNQLAADACGRPVVAGPVEATVLGNLLVQARSAGELANAGRSPRNRRGRRLLTATYEPRGTARWHECVSAICRPGGKIGPRCGDLKTKRKTGWIQSSRPCDTERGVAAVDPEGLHAVR